MDFQQRSHQQKAPQWHLHMRVINARPHYLTGEAQASHTYISGYISCRGTIARKALTRKDILSASWVTYAITTSSTHTHAHSHTQTYAHTHMLGHTSDTTHTNAYTLWLNNTYRYTCTPTYLTQDTCFSLTYLFSFNKHFFANSRSVHNWMQTLER